MRITEIETLNENETLVIIEHPKPKSLSEFLANLTAERIIQQLPKGNFDQGKEVRHPPELLIHVMPEFQIRIPVFRIHGSCGLESVFNKKQPKFAPFFGSPNPFAAPRMFSAYKAEFHKIIGYYNSEAKCMVFALYDFYCKFRCHVSFGLFAS